VIYCEQRKQNAAFLFSFADRVPEASWKRVERKGDEEVKDLEKSFAFPFRHVSNIL